MNQKEGTAIVDLATRTKAFALRIIRLFGALPKAAVAQVLGKQLLRSGTSVGAHYREATRARSTAEFVSKVQGGLAELEETAYWLELLAESGIIRASRLHDIRREADELTAILVTCANNASKKDPRTKGNRK
ncbi:MAG: four helix bundle protein [Pirellulales bacterium]